MWGLVFLSPWFIGFSAFYFLPIVASLVFSFTKFNLIYPDDIEWIGWANYLRVFTDPVTVLSAIVTFRFAAIAIPVGIIQPILMAAMLNSKRLWAKRIFTTLFFMPFIVPLVSAVYIWQGMFNQKTGWINMALGGVGIDPGPDWLNDVRFIYPALVIIGLWGVGQAMLITLAGMQGITTELYEAASIDGAGPVRSFFSITLPLITPIIFYNLVLALIAIFQYFLIPFILSKGTGNPANSTLFYAMQLYRTAFTFSDMGYGAAMAWVMFIAAMIVTALLFGSAKYWVYYAGEER